MFKGMHGCGSTQDNSRRRENKSVPAGRSDDKYVSSVVGASRDETRRRMIQLA